MPLLLLACPRALFILETYLLDCLSRTALSEAFQLYCVNATPRPAPFRPQLAWSVRSPCFAALEHPRNHLGEVVVERHEIQIPVDVSQLLGMELIAGASRKARRCYPSTLVWRQPSPAIRLVACPLAERTSHPSGGHVVGSIVPACRPQMSHGIGSHLLAWDVLTLDLACCVFGLLVSSSLDYVIAYSSKSDGWSPNSSPNICFGPHLGPEMWRRCSCLSHPIPPP